MIDRIRNWLAQIESGKPPKGDFSARQLAAATLLVEAARLDGRMGEEEKRKIGELLAGHFGLSDEEVAALIAAGEASAEEAVQIQRFTSAIKRDTDYEERVALIEMLWEVVYADGRLHHYEDNLLRRVGGLLYVSDRDRGEAGKRVRARLGLEAPDAG